MDASSTLQTSLSLGFNLEVYATLIGFLTVVLLPVRVAMGASKINIWLKDSLIVLTAVGFGLLYNYLIAPAFHWEIRDNATQVVFISVVYTLYLIGVIEVGSSTTKKTYVKNNGGRH